MVYGRKRRRARLSRLPRQRFTPFKRYVLNDPRLRTLRDVPAFSFENGLLAQQNSGVLCVAGQRFGVFGSRRITHSQLCLIAPSIEVALAAQPHDLAEFTWCYRVLLVMPRPWYCAHFTLPYESLARIFPFSKRWSGQGLYPLNCFRLEFADRERRIVPQIPHRVYVRRTKMNAVSLLEEIDTELPRDVPVVAQATIDDDEVVVFEQEEDIKSDSDDDEDSPVAVDSSSPDSSSSSEDEYDDDDESVEELDDESESEVSCFGANTAAFDHSKVSFGLENFYAERAVLVQSSGFVSAVKDVSAELVAALSARMRARADNVCDLYERMRKGFVIAKASGVEPVLDDAFASALFSLLRGLKFYDPFWNSIPETFKCNDKANLFLTQLESSVASLRRLGIVEVEAGEMFCSLIAASKKRRESLPQLIDDISNRDIANLVSFFASRGFVW